MFNTVPRLNPERQHALLMISLGRGLAARLVPGPPRFQDFRIVRQIRPCRYWGLPTVVGDLAVQPGYSAYVLATVGLSTPFGCTTYSVCQQVTYGTGKQWDCTELGRIGSLRTKSADTASVDQPGGAQKRDLGLTSHIDQLLQKSGVAFDSTNVLPLEVRDQDNENTTSIQVLSTRDENGNATDHLVKIRVGGTAVSRTTFPSPPV
ncbi:hypothetical protein F4818DRAFT_451845 [Hypoxylon cercidicola]|nr:hypothetical protein F4818DRAFT_451845 [Hypoxylon cercidicola]